jgi:hypothetical protein
MRHRILTLWLAIPPTCGNASASLHATRTRSRKGSRRPASSFVPNQLGAKRLNLAVPPAFLASVDEVID